MAQIRDMSSEKRRKRDVDWKVIRLKARGEYLGTVSAPDEDAALKRAIKTFAITAPHAQKSLLVKRTTRS
jgi:hypothetical protein